MKKLKYVMEEIKEVSFSSSKKIIFFLKSKSYLEDKTHPSGTHKTFFEYTNIFDKYQKSSFDFGRRKWKNS
jgi:hypothetical protein